MNARLTGRAVRLGDPTWDNDRKGFAVDVPYDDNVPSAVVFCSSASDVSNAVRFAVENSQQVVVRSGRHNYEGYSSLSTGGIVLDVSAMNTVSISLGKETAEIGAGSTVHKINATLGEHSVMIPLATSPTVGIAGLTLAGGFGMTSRKWGLTCDSLISLSIVLADGSIAEASLESNPDLFWACCGGGGGNFGIVTSLVFQLHPTTTAGYFSVGYPWAKFSKVIRSFERWIKDVDDSLTAFLSLTSDRSIVLHGQVTTDNTVSSHVISLIDAMIDSSLLPFNIQVHVASYQTVARAIMELDPLDDSLDNAAFRKDQIFKSTSTFVFEPLPLRVIENLKSKIESLPKLSAPPSQPSMIQLLGGGGRIAHRPPYATAAHHRKALYLFQINGYWSERQDKEPTRAWVNTLRDSLKANTVGAYVGYSDSNLRNPLDEYYGANLGRLIAVKTKYDPSNVFRFAHSIPLIEPANILSCENLLNSPIVANSKMNRARVLAGPNSYTKEVGFDIYTWIIYRTKAKGSCVWYDACCGEGTALLETHRQLENQDEAKRIRLIGVDLVGSLAGTSNPLVTVADVAKYSPDVPADLITCVHGLQYIGDKLALLEHLYQILTPEGLMAVNIDFSNIVIDNVRVKSWSDLCRRCNVKSPPGNYLKHLIKVNKSPEIGLRFGLSFQIARESAAPNYTGITVIDSFYTSD